MSTNGTQAAFDFSEFDTDVSRADEDRVIETIAQSIELLRDQIDDDTLEGVFRGDPGQYTMRSDFTRDQLDPEPLTKSRVIEPLLNSLNYESYGYEAGSFSDERGEQADYAVSLRDIDSVDSSRLLIEAEPMNKVLKDRGHGLDQVKSWLSQREFESDFGFATDGVRWIFVRYDPDSYSHNIIESVDLQPVFLALFENASTEQQPPTVAVSDEHRELISKLLRTFEYNNFVSIIDEAREVIKRKQEEITDEFYDDYIQVVFGVEDDADERRARSLIGEGIVPPDEADGDDIRLFAVDLMNRLIFVKFLEDKRIVRSDLLDVLTDTYESGIYPQSLYKTFLDPLFYDVFNEKPDDRDPQVADLDVYSGVPYLNGGLFRPQLNGTETLDERDFDVHDSVLESIIDLLERYQFSTDGGPTDIDPSVLGNVFEKTINYLTTDAGDQNKELGAYYTPKEITRFSAEETVRPALLDRFKQVLQDERGWPEAEVEQYDTLYQLIDGLPGSGDLITTLLSELDDFYVVDPGMGSGHFLTSVVEEIVNVRQALYAQQDSQPSRHRLKKTTVQNNIYGVDIVEPAVEIGKLRLWLSIISELREEDLEDLDVEEIALPNITFNVRRGNSLIGYVGFPEETEDGLATFERWSENSVQSRYEDLIEQIELYEAHRAFPERAEEHRQRANELLEQYRSELNSQILDDFRDVVDDVTDEDLEGYTPFHWVLEFAEVYAEGGFDVIVGNPPWDVLSASRDEFFSRHHPEFRGLPQPEKDTVQEELLDSPEIAEKWTRYQRDVEVQSEYFKNSGEYELQTPTVAGDTATYKNDLSKLFFERVFQLADEEGYVAQVLPGVIFNGQGSKDLRMKMVDEAQVQSLVEFENKGIFENIHQQYRFGVVVFKNSGRTEELKGIFHQRDTDVLQNFDNEAIDIPRRVLAEYSPEARIFPVVTSQQQVDVLDQVLQHPPLGKDIDDRWKAVPLPEELNKTRDSDRFVREESEGDYPVYAGENIHQFHYDETVDSEIESLSIWSVEEDVDHDLSGKRRVREKRFNKGEPKKAIYEKFDGDKTSKSQKQFVNDLLEEHRGQKLSEEDVLLDCEEYRIGFRDVTNSTNERTMIASVLPRGSVCVHTLQTVRPYSIEPPEEDLSADPLHDVYKQVFTYEELMCAVGLLNSIPFDYLMRTKISTHVVKYKFMESQVPRLTEGDEWFEFIWRRAARLNCYGGEFEELRDRLGGIEPATDTDEREKIQAELDAASFHAYGLDREQTEFVLDDFYRVRDPRRMTDEYFERVLAKYDELMDR